MAKALVKGFKQTEIDFDIKSHVFYVNNEVLFYSKIILKECVKNTSKSEEV